MRFNFEQMQHVWSRSLTAETIAEPLQTISLYEDVSEAVKRMKSNTFDVLGLESKSVRTVGFIEFDENLEGTCEDHLHSFDIEQVVSLQTPLKDCLSLFEYNKRLFVLGKTGVEGIITLADLHKQPVRMLLFSVISLLEMTMVQLIRNYYPNGLWCDKLSENRLQIAQDLYDERKKIGQDIDLDDCLQLCDKKDILLTIDFWKDWEFDSKTKTSDFFSKITVLRNNIAHSQENIWSDISSIISLCDTAEGLIETNINAMQADIRKAAIDG